MSKPVLKTGTPAATDAAALQRRATGARLRKSREGLEAFLTRLQALHADRSGSFGLYYASLPLLPDEARSRLTSIARTKKEAANGCEQCAAWLEETSDLREQIEGLRNTRLPGQAADYSGPFLNPSHARHAGRVRSAVSYRSGRQGFDVAALLAEQEANRAERKARGTALLQDYQREVAEAAEAKAAAGVPH